jgi:PiT family inorganic phosphate transporter
VAVTAEGGLVLARGGLELTADQVGVGEQRDDGRVVGFPAAGIVDWLHMGSAASLGFARGLNDTPKVMALLVAAAWSGLSVPLSLAMIAAAMAAGGILAARRVAETLGHRITVMNRGQGLIANAVGSALVIAASIFGLPVSTTHVSTGAIFGIGTWTGHARWRVMGKIIAAWLATLPLGLALGYAVARFWQ